MKPKISVVINTRNEEKNIERAIVSAKWADEIVVCDMHSTDETVAIAKKLGAKVVFYENVNYVEPARNFAIGESLGDWVLILDADEEIPDSLAKRLTEMLEKPIVSTFVEIPRKNIIFNRWVKASMWWPDYNIRFFKKGSVEWEDKIHSRPKTVGQGVRLPEEERWAITHHHYDSLSQYLQRMDRYTTIQATELKESGAEFVWSDLISKPLGEFLSRFFANRGFEDGIHGLALSLLQAFSFLVVYLKLWEYRGFKEQNPSLKEFKDLSKSSGSEINYWFKYGNLSENPIKRVMQKARNRLS